MNPNHFPSEEPLENLRLQAIFCTSKPDCRCEFCAVTRFQPTEEDVLALDFIAKFATNRRTTVGTKH